MMPVAGRGAYLRDGGGLGGGGVCGGRGALDEQLGEELHVQVAELGPARSRRGWSGGGRVRHGTESSTHGCEMSGSVTVRKTAVRPDKIPGSPVAQHTCRRDGPMTW